MTDTSAIQLILDNMPDSLLAEYQSWEDQYDRLEHEVSLSLAGRRVG